MIKLVLRGLNKDSRIPKHDFYCTYIPLLTYPLTENIGMFTEYFGLEGEQLRNYHKQTSKNFKSEYQTIRINEEALTKLRKMYGDTTKNQMIVQACNNAMGGGQIGEECNTHIEKFQDTLNRLVIQTTQNIRVEKTPWKT